ncbi:MAG: dockerin type I repeat-containing protein [Ruminococcus sp.]|nr:dockerin type I repeat-containing protein [Ruminococcus sp.]
MKRLIAYLLALLVAVVGYCSTVPSAAAFDMDDLKNEKQMELGYSIINGYSKLSARKGLTSFDKTAVYCGQDLSNPYLLALAGTFYLTHGVDLERTLTDNAYALQLVRELNGYLAAFGVKNERLRSLKTAIVKEGIKPTESLDSVGLLFIKTDSACANRLMRDDRVDFVFAGGAVPSSMKDLNMDGKSNQADAVYIQRYLAEDLTFPDSDENEYIKFAGDINGDKHFDINDATKLYAV